jgi:hypothetical protein
MTELAANQNDMSVAHRMTEAARSERLEQQTNGVWAKLADRFWTHAEETEKMDTRPFRGLL